MARARVTVAHDNDQAVSISAIWRCSLARTGAHRTKVGRTATSAALTIATRRPRSTRDANHATSGIAAVETPTFTMLSQRSERHSAMARLRKPGYPGVRNAVVTPPRLYSPSVIRRNAML